MPRIFICYRREDTSGHAGRLDDTLSAEFGGAEIFRDLDTIAPGEDFVQAMSRGIRSCHVFLAIIGRRWLAAADANGRRRLDDPADHVRTELAEALQHGVRVIPVLVQGAPMPRAADLPDPIRPLASRNAIDLDDEGWESDVKRLVAAIRAEVPASAVRRRNVAAMILANWRTAVGVAAALVIAAVLMTLRWSKDASDYSVSSSKAPPQTSADGAKTGAPSGPQIDATFPAGAEAEIGGRVYEVVAGDVSGGTEGRSLNVRIRLTNLTRYDVSFSNSDFRLAVNGELRAPDGALADVVPAESAKESSVRFPLPPAAATATLRITEGRDAAEIPLDLNGRVGPTAAQDRELRRTGRRSFALRIDPASARPRFGQLTCELRSASLHRYAHKLTLTLQFRATNDSRYDMDFGDGHFRLVVDGMTRPPVSGLSTIVQAEGSRDGAIVFDLPLDAREVVVRVRFGDETAVIPLHVPSTVTGPP